MSSRSQPDPAPPPRGLKRNVVEPMFMVAFAVDDPAPPPRGLKRNLRILRLRWLSILRRPRPTSEGIETKRESHGIDVIRQLEGARPRPTSEGIETISRSSVPWPSACAGCASLTPPHLRGD